MGSPLLDAFKCPEGLCFLLIDRDCRGPSHPHHECVGLASISKIYLFYEAESSVYDAAHVWRGDFICWLRQVLRLRRPMTRFDVGWMTVVAKPALPGRKAVNIE
jgi:hypothetical protein